jgi:protease IV
MKKNTALGCLSAFLALGLMACLGVIIFMAAKSRLSDAEGMDSLGSISSFSSGATPPPALTKRLEQRPPSGKSGQGQIAKIDIEGVIMGDSRGSSKMLSQTLAQLNEAARDSQVKAILLRIDSPGGEVTASDTIYHRVKKVAEIKPVVVYMDSVAASGGYYIACGGTKIIAHPTAITGSIGVIMQAPGYQDLLTKVGMEWRTFKSGAMKDAGSGSRAMTPEEREYFQRLVMQNYERFVGIVAEARKKSVDMLKNGPADGRIFIGEEARVQGLVDETGYIEQAYQVARDLSGAKDAEVISYKRKADLSELFALFSDAEARDKTTRLEVTLPTGMRTTLQPGLPYFLYSPWAE